MQVSRYTLLSALSLCALATPAFADDYKVYSPVIEGHERAVEANLNYDVDHRHDQDKYFSQVYAAEYAITDHWKTELGVEVEKNNSENMKATNLKWENIINPFATGENWMDAALYLEAEKSLEGGSPNNLEAKILLEKSVGKFVNTANFKVERSIGPNSEKSVGTGFALKTKYRMDPMFEPGLEYFADTGPMANREDFKDQNHQFGPAIDGKIGNVRYNTAALFGVSDAAPDATIKLNLEYEF